MKIIDAHCHIFPDAIALHAAETISRFYGQPIAADGRVETLLRMDEAAGISRQVVSSVATTPHQVAAINRFIHETVQAQPARFTGLGALHPDSADQAADVEQVLALGLAGVKLHPEFQGVAVDDPRYLEIFALCEGRLPVLCHLGDARQDLSCPRRVRRVLERFPRLTLIGAHLGGWSQWAEAAETLHGYDNLLTDSSSSLFALAPEEAVRLIRLYGAERVLFGTDYPMWTPAGEVARFDALPLTEAERALILHRNAERVFGMQV